MRLVFWGILFLPIFCVSCVSSEKVFANVQGENSKKKLEFFNGVYSNEPSDIKDEFSAFPLYETLFKPFYSFGWKETRDFTGTIEFEVISKRKIKASYYSSGALLETKTLKGVFKDGVFSVRRKIRPIGIPLIYFFLGDVKIIFGSSKSGDLIVSCGKSSFGNILIMAGGGESFFRERYEKLE